MRVVNSFFMAGEPPRTSSQQKRYDGRSKRFFKSKNLALAETYFIERATPYIPDVPYDGPIALYSLWLFSVKSKKLWGSWKTTKPDCDNINKLFQDTLGWNERAKGFKGLHFWNDDAQIASLTVEKRFADANEEPGIYVEIALLDESDYSLGNKCNANSRLWVIDKHTGDIHRIGDNRHDALTVLHKIDENGKISNTEFEIHYHNMQNGDGGGCNDVEGYGYQILSTDCGFFDTPAAPIQEEYRDQIRGYLKAQGFDPDSGYWESESLN